MVVAAVGLLVLPMLSGSLLAAAPEPAPPKESRRAVMQVRSGHRLVAALSELAAAAGAFDADLTLRLGESGRSATSAASTAPARLDALVRAYERVRAEDLLFRDRIATIGRRLEEAGASGPALERWRVADRTYREHLDEHVSRADAALARWRKGFREPMAHRTAGESAERRRLEAELQSALSDAASRLAPIEPSPRILRAASLPHRSLELAARRPITSPAVIPSYLDATDPAPTAADVAGTAESPLSETLVAQAAALEHDPVAIFEFVRNDVATEWYAGAMKGAEETLRQRAGNDIDQAALLVALLRASSQPARFVHGVVELPLPLAAQSLNVSEGPQVLLALARAGVAHEPVVRGGRLAAVEVEHTWVSARLPYGNYRGTVVDLSARTWVPLAPALEGFEGAGSTAALRQMGFDSVAFARGYMSAPQTSDPLAQVRQQVQSWLAVHQPEANYADQLGDRSVTPQRFGLAPSSLPVAVVAVVAEQAALDPARIQRLELAIREDDSVASSPLLEHALPVWDVANRRVTLSYLPATVDDHRTIDLFGGLDAVPPYLVRLRPQVRIAGRLVAVGEGTVDMASRNVVELRLVGPAGTVEVSQSLVAGGLQALAVGAQRFLPLADEGGDPGDGEGPAARLLSELSLAYGAAWDLADAELGGLLAVSPMRPLPALVFAASELSVITVGELPVDLDWQGVTLDAALRFADPVARDAAHQGSAGRDFLRLSSLQGSSLEQRVLEERFVVEAISADEGIARSRAVGIPVHDVDETNLDEVLSLLQHPPAVLAQIEEQARGGLKLEVPQRRVRHRDWLGSAWRAENPATGASGYFLAGGLAGGATVVEPGSWPVRSFVWDLMAPYAAEPNTDPLSAARIVKVGGTDGQVGEVGELLPHELAVLVFDDVGRPVQGAVVTFESSLGGGLLGDARSSVTVPTDRLGIASAPLRLGTDTSLEPILLQLEPDDARFTRALRHVVEAAVTTRAEAQWLADPFTAVALPGPAVTLERMNERSQPIRGTAGLWSDTMLVSALDAHGNEVSNVPLRFAVGPVEEIGRCASNILAPDPLLNAAVFSTEAGCGATQPRLGDCGGPVLTLPSGPTGTAAGVILGNSFRNAYRVHVDAPDTPSLEGVSLSYRYEDQSENCRGSGTVVRAAPLYVDGTGANVNAASADGTFGFEVQLFVYDGYPLGSELVECPEGVAGQCVVGGGELVQARAERLYLRRGDGITGDWLTDEVPLVAGADHVYRASMEVPAGRNEYWVVGGNVTHVVDSDTGQIRQVRDDSCVTEAFYCVGGRAPDVTGLAPRVTGIVPQPVELDDSGTFPSPVEVSYLTLPETYRGLGTVVELLDEGAPVLRRPGSSRSGAGTATLPRGAHGTHAQLIVNPSSPVEVRSPIVPLSLSSRLFPSFSRHVELRQDVDLANGRICRQPEVFRFTLARDARVDLTLRQIVDLGPGEEPSLGSGQTLLLRDLEAGEHAVPLLPEELLPGLYKVILAGTDTQGVEEIEEGTAQVGLRASDALPLGHVLVQGVDLYDGSLVLSREDFSVAGRGVALSLSRTYASGAGGALGPLGAGWTFSYDSQIVATPCGELILRGGEGSGIRFVSDGAGGFRPLRGYHGTLVADPARFGFDFYAKAGNRYHFEPSQPNEWVLDSIADPNGNLTDLSYVPGPTGGLQLASVTDPAGRMLRFRWERREFVTATADVIVRVEGPAGLAVSYAYDSWGNLAGASREPHEDGRPSRVEHYGYATGPQHPLEQRHLLVSATDAVRSAVTRYTYSSGGIALPNGGVIVHRDFVEELRRPEGGIWRFAPDYAALAGNSEELVTRVTDPRDQVTTYTLNRYGAPLAVTDPLGGTTSTTWDLEHVVVTSRTDGNGSSTAYTYDQHGNLLTERVEVGDVDGDIRTLVLTNSYWPPETFSSPFVKDRLATRTDRAGRTTRFAYDGRGNLLASEIEVEDAAGGVSELATAHSHYPNGDLRSTTDPRGNTTVFAYDAAGNLASVTDPRGGVTATAWDERSRPTRRTDAEGRTTTFAHDTLGRELERTLPGVPGESDAVERISYADVTGTQTETDAEGRATTSQRDREGRLVRVVDATGAVKVFGYDAAGNLTLETSRHDASTARNDTAFLYDPAGRLVRRDEPIGRRTVYEYDAAGNLTRETLGDALDPTFPTRVTEHDYDEAGRRIRSRRVGDGLVVTKERKLDGEGRELLLRDALGRETMQRFDSLGRLIERAEPEWRVGERKRTLLFYDANGNLTRERRLNEPSDQQREWQYDELDRPVLRRDATGAATILDYDRVGNLVREVDPLLDVVEHAYDPRNQRTATTEHLDRVSDLGRVTTSYEYDRVGNLVAERLPNGNVRRHRYDARDRLIESSDGLGALAAFTHDARGNRTREVDANGNVTVDIYDALDRLVRQDLPANRRLLRTYDAAGNLVAETDPRGHAVRRTYDRLDRLVEVHDPAPHTGVRRFTYDIVGNKVTETDRRGLTTELAYDALDRLVAIVTPPLAAEAGARLTTSFAYDAVGNQIGETDRRGIRTERTYDAENRLIETARAAVRTESREYDAAGNLRFTTEANGHVIGYEYDERGMIVSENRPLAAITTFRRDVMGDVATERDPEGRETQRLYDLRRRVVEERNGSGERTLFEHDGVGNRTARIRPNAEGNSGLFRWEYDFDAANRLVAVRDPTGAETRHGYDGNGNRVSQRDALDRTTSFTFDELDRRTTLIYPGGAEERYGYDAEGNLTSRVDPNAQSFATTYDELGRVALESFPTPGGAGVDELASIAYRRDSNGNLLSATETYTGPTGTRTTRTSYDPFDRPEVVTDAFGKTLRYGYDAAGNRTTLTDPDGLVTRYSYDALNRVAQVELPPGGGVAEYRYLRDSRLDAMLYPGGVHADHTYDPAGRVQTIVNRSATELVSSYVYRYDRNGNRVEQVETNGGPAETTLYEYDVADRLLEVAYPEAVVTYTYDAVGNRRVERRIASGDGAILADKVFSYDDRDRLLEVVDDAAPAESATYRYDANGNQIARTRDGLETRYRFDTRDQIVGIDEDLEGGGFRLLGRYLYDWQGLRVEKRWTESAGDPTVRHLRFTWDDQRLLAEHGVDGAPVARYEHGPDGLLRQSHRTQGGSWYLADGLGTPTTLLADDGAVRERVRYDAWGLVRSRSGASENRFGFTGHELDAESDLYYARARFFDTTLGRFLSEDPFAGLADTPPSLHRYTYAHVNPTVYTDPTGMAVGDWWDVRSYADGELWRENAHDLWNLASLGTLERVQQQSDLGTWRGVVTSLDIAGEQIVNTGSLGLSQNLLARVEETGTLGAGDVWAAASTTAYQLTPIDEIRQVVQEHDQMSGGEIAVALSLAVSKSAGLTAGVRAAAAPRAAVSSTPRINLAGDRSHALTAGAQRAAAARAAQSTPNTVKAVATVEASTTVGAKIAAAEVTRSVPAVVDGGIAGASGLPPRPTWQTAQAGPASNLEGFGFTPEPSYVGGQRVPYGTRGSVRPDYASELMGLSVDVKNYAVETPQGRWRLVNDVVGQTSDRAANLPPGMRQGVVIDTRGQSVSDLLLQRMIDRIIKKSNGLIEPENVVIQR